MESKFWNWENIQSLDKGDKFKFAADGHTYEIRYRGHYGVDYALVGDRKAKIKVMRVNREVLHFNPNA